MGKLGTLSSASWDCDTRCAPCSGPRMFQEDDDDASTVEYRRPAFRPPSGRRARRAGAMPPKTTPTKGATVVMRVPVPAARGVVRAPSLPDVPPDLVLERSVRQRPMFAVRPIWLIAAAVLTLLGWRVLPAIGDRVFAAGSTLSTHADP